MRIFLHFFYTKLFEMEEKNIIKWGSFDNLLAENEEKFVLK